MIALLSFALPLLFFIAFPSHLWNFDGVACAAALELSNPVFLFHSNHLLYGFLGFLFWKGLSPWIFPRALSALQLFTSLLTSAGLFGLYKTLQKLLPHQGLAFLMTLCVSVSAVVWVWSVEAQVYALGFLSISWATYWLFKKDRPGKWLWVGGLHAGAVLSHIVHVLWIVPACYWIWKEDPRTRFQKLRPYLLALGVGTIVPYALVIGLVIVPHHLHDQWVPIWLMGSAALNPNSVFQWHFAGWTGPLLWAATSLHVFWGSFWPYQTLVPAWGWVLTAISAGILVALFGLSFKQRKDPRWVFCMLWIAVYGIFFWTWEPRMECYRMTDLVPIAVLLSLGVKALGKQNVQGGLLTLLFISLACINFSTRIYPMSDIRRNHLYQQTVDLANATPGESVYLTLGSLPWLYLLYFSGRTALDLHSILRHSISPEKDIARLVSLHPVFIQTDAFQTDWVKPWLAPYQERPLTPSLPWLQLK